MDGLGADRSHRWMAERRRVAGSRLDSADRNPESGDGIPPLDCAQGRLLRDRADRSGRNDGRGRRWRGRQRRSIWEIMRKLAQSGCGRRVKNRGFPPKKEERRQTYDE